MGEFRTLLIEGVFYEEDGVIKASRDGSAEKVLVEETLAAFVGEQVQIAIHHLPPHPINPDRWGGGCCLWEPSGKCPAGHHEHPDYLLNVAGQGVLHRDGSKWFLDKFDGSRQEFPLSLLVGHTARVVAACLFDVEKMRESLGNLGGPVTVETLGVRAEKLKDLLSQLGDFVKKVQD